MRNMGAIVIHFLGKEENKGGRRGGREPAFGSV